LGQIKQDRPEDALAERFAVGSTHAVGSVVAEISVAILGRSEPQLWGVEGRVGVLERNFATAVVAPKSRDWRNARFLGRD
jgi:hypothetical protein